MLWETLTVIAILTTLVNLPVDLAFFTSPKAEEYTTPTSNYSVVVYRYKSSLKKQYPVWYGINLFTDVTYMADMALMFRTGYVDSTTEKVGRRVYLWITRSGWLGLFSVFFVLTRLLRTDSRWYAIYPVYPVALPFPFVLAFVWRISSNFCEVLPWHCCVETRLEHCGY